MTKRWLVLQLSAVLLGMVSLTTPDVVLAVGGQGKSRLHAASHSTVKVPKLFTVGPSVMGVTEYRMSNGLTVLLYPDETATYSKVSLLYKVGARHDFANQKGISRLVAHLVIRSLKENPVVRRALIDTASDPRWNGRVSLDDTLYSDTVRNDPKELERLIGLMAVTMSKAKFTEGMLRKEVQIVLDKIAQDESVGQAIGAAQDGASYGLHPYGQGINGTKDTLSNITVESANRFHREWYRPDNAYLLIAGKFDQAKVLRAIEKIFGLIRRPATPLNAVYTPEPVQQGERDVVVRRPLGTGSFTVSYHAPNLASSDGFALAALMASLISEPDGELYKRLKKSGLATEIEARLESRTDGSQVVFDVTPSSTEQMQAVWEVLVRFIEEDLSTSEEALTRVKLNTFNRSLEWLETPDNAISVLLTGVHLGDWRRFYFMREQMYKLTSEALIAAGKRWLVRDNRTTVRYIPTEEVRRAPVVDQRNIPAIPADFKWPESAPRVTDYPLNIQSIRRHRQTGVLKSGVKYAFLPRKLANDKVRVSLDLHWGDEQSLKGRWREADLIGSVVPSGTATIPYQVYSDALSKLNADLSIDAGPRGASLSLVVPRQHLKEALALGLDTLRNPLFPDDRVEEVRTVLINEKEQELSDSYTQDLKRQKAEYLYQYKPEEYLYERRDDEIVADVKQQTPARMKAFWEEFSGATTGELVVMGDVVFPEVKAQIEAALDGWKSKHPYGRIEKKHKALPNGRHVIRLREFDGVMYFKGHEFEMTTDHPDFPALRLAMDILGRGSGSRLYRRFREKEGLGYDIQASFDVEMDDPHAGISYNATFLPKDLERAERAIQDEIDRAARYGFTQKELKRARKAWLDARRDHMKREENVVRELSNSLFLDVDLDGIESLDKSIRKVNLEDVNRAFRRWAVMPKDKEFVAIFRDDLNE